MEVQEALRQASAQPARLPGGAEADRWQPPPRVRRANCQVLGGSFEASETTEGYLGVLEHYVAKYGARLALYSDRHTAETAHQNEQRRVGIHAPES